jgi:hypothetical protein
LLKALVKKPTHNESKDENYHHIENKRP